MLPVAQSLGIDQAAVTGEVAVGLESADLAYFHRDGHPQDSANPGNGQQLFVQRDFPRAAQHRLLYPRDALVQRLNVLGLHLSD